MAKRPESERLEEITRIERPFWERGDLPAGMDEAGRGPLAGPVTAACVILPPDPLIPHINDSKKLAASRREALYTAIRERAVAFGVGWSGPEEIDRINILEATKAAFASAYGQMNHPCKNVLVDAVKGLAVDAEQHAFFHGDALSYLIAAASILAKVERDAYMLRMHEKYPQYGFDRNKGYGTAAHMAALRQYGPCPIHRKTFLRRLFGG